MKNEKKDDDNLESILTDKKEAAQLNEYLRRLKNLVGDIDEENAGIDPKIVQKPELVLAFQVFFLTTPFTRQPLGLAAIADLHLLNLENFIDD